MPQKITTSRHNGNIITSAQSLSSPCNVKRYFELLRNLEALAKYAVSRQPLSDLLAWTTKQERGLSISLGPYLLLLSFSFFFFFIFIKSQYQYVTNIGHLLDLIRLVLTVCAEIFLL